MGFCYIRTTPGPENHASLLMHLGWLLRGEGPSCSPVHPVPRRQGITGPFLPPATRPVQSQLPAHRVGCSTELGLQCGPFRNGDRSSWTESGVHRVEQPGQLAAEAGLPHWLRQPSPGRVSSGHPEPRGWVQTLAPQGPLRSESYGPEARPSVSVASDPQDRAALPGVEGHARGFAVIKNKPRLEGSDNMKWGGAVLY